MENFAHQKVPLHLQRLKTVMEENLKFLEENNVNNITYRERKAIFIVTTWRSGSTFFGEVLSSHPAIFYHYEPLARFGFQELSSGNGLEEAISDLQNLSECEYDDLKEYLIYVQNDSSVFKYNEKIDVGCQYLSGDCYMPIFPSTICKLFPIQLFKIIRLQVSDLKIFLQTPNFYILLLLRDPRATYASRRKLDWCMSVDRCIDMDLECNIIKENLGLVHKLKLVYPKQILLVRYEDVAAKPVEEFKKIFKELGIPWHKYIQNSIELHTNTDVDMPWSTYRISHTRINNWKSELSPVFINYVQDRCWPILENATYERINFNETTATKYADY